MANIKNPYQSNFWKCESRGVGPFAKVGEESLTKQKVYFLCCFFFSCAEISKEPKRISQPYDHILLKLNEINYLKCF